MAKEDTAGLPEVEVIPAAEATAKAMADAKTPQEGYVTDVSKALSVEDINGTKLVRW